MTPSITKTKSKPASSPWFHDGLVIKSVNSHPEGSFRLTNIGSIYSPSSIWEVKVPHENNAQQFSLTTLQSLSGSYLSVCTWLQPWPREPHLLPFPKVTLTQADAGLSPVAELGVGLREAKCHLQESLP